MAEFPQTRLRRNRRTPALRDLLQETHLHPEQVIQPIFVKHGSHVKHEIQSMPGQYQFSLDNLAEQVKRIEDVGVKSIIVFGIPEHKDETGSDAYNTDGIIAKSVQLIKEVAPSMQVVTDVCCCEYTHHGHCGVINTIGGRQDVHNDKTLALLCQQAQVQAKAGADIIAPSGMVDGQVTAIRHALDDAGFTHIPIMSYAVKYASSLYGPFRDAAEGAPKFGDRRAYQMNPANSNEALREAELDIQEGADMLMVKPAGMYLDIIQRLKTQYPQIPLAAYQVSGEYSMIKAASKNGWLNEADMIQESLLAIKRAGADIIISYFAADFCAKANRK